MKTLNLLMSIILVAPVSVAFADNNSDTHTSTTDSAGSTVTTDTSHTDSVGILGTKKSTEDVKTVVDPPGLLNKETTKKHSERQAMPSGDYVESTTINHANGTEENVKAERNTIKHWTNKGETATTTNTRTVDPKGLGNKQTLKEEEVVQTNPGHPEKRILNSKVNGG